MCPMIRARIVNSSEINHRYAFLRVMSAPPTKAVDRYRVSERTARPLEDSQAERGIATTAINLTAHAGILATSSTLLPIRLLIVKRDAWLEVSWCVVTRGAFLRRYCW